MIKGDAVADCVWAHGWGGGDVGWVVVVRVRGGVRTGVGEEWRE